MNQSSLQIAFRGHVFSIGARIVNRFGFISFGHNAMKRILSKTHTGYSNTAVEDEEFND